MMVLCAYALARGASAYDTIRFLEPIKAEEMAKPVAAASRGKRIYALDEKKCALLIYDDGKLTKVVGRCGSEKGAFKAPRGVSVGAQGRVFVADTGNSRIQILDADGNFLWYFGERGSDPGQLKSPQSVAVGADGRVFVADTGNDRVQVFTQEGILLFEFGGKSTVARETGRFGSPSRVAVDPSDNIYVLDQGNDRIQKFDASAKFVKDFNLLGGDFGVDAFGYFYVLDAKNGKVIEQSPDGNILGKFGSYGSGPGQFKKPAGVAVGSDGTIIVLDTGNNRIQRIEVANKLKTATLPVNLATKLLVTGPSRVWNVPAEVLAPLDDDLYAYLPKEGQFAILDLDGKEKKRFGTKQGKTPSVTRGTRGFAASRKMGLFVADNPNNRLQSFGLDGTWKANLAESTGFFDSKKKEGRVKDPRGVAINDEGTIYIADTGNQRVDAFSPEGVFLFGFGPQIGSLEMKEPTSVAWDKSGFVYVADKGLKRVFKCEPSGSLITTYGEEGDGPGQFQSPSAIAFDGNNYLYVLDDQHRRVSVFAKDGRWMTDLFAGGKQERELQEPVAVAVQGTRLMIADKGKKRVVSFDLHPTLAAPVSITTATKDGLAALSWTAIADPWTSGYKIYRSTDGSSFVEIASTGAARFVDQTVVPYEKYFYKVATEAKTKDVGPPSPAVELFIAGAFNKSPVEISTIAIGNIFSANYKWYLKNPVGKLTLTNNVNLAFQNVKVTFRLKDFMDFGYDTEIKKLAPQQSVDIPLIATLNNKILEVSEDTPIQAEFTLTYFEGGKQQTVSLTKSLRVYSRNAITWEDPRRIANFITPKDPPIFDFARESLRSAPKKAGGEVLNRGLGTAIQLWDSLSEAGVKFFSSPNNPYEKISEDPNFPVDYTQFPRETLKRRAGQCDDLVTLLISMLDGNKVRAAILDYPGHMALMFDTESSDPAEIGIPEDRLIKHGDTYWIPVEATLIGKPFQEAVEKGLFSYKSESEKGKVRIIDVRQAWTDYEPATLPAVDWSLEVPTAASRERRYAEEVGAFASERYKFLKAHYQDLIKADGKDLDSRVQLGLVEFQAGKKDAAIGEFNKILAFDPKNAAALTNLGNVAFLAGENDAAASQYLKAAESEPEDADIWLNLLKTELRRKNKDKAREYGEKAVALDRSLKPAVENLLK